MEGQTQSNRSFNYQLLRTILIFKKEEADIVRQELHSMGTDSKVTNISSEMNQLPESWELWKMNIIPQQSSRSLCFERLFI